MLKSIGFACGCAFVFLLGILAGIAIDAKQRTNIVRMAVQLDSHEVFVAPFVGDTVVWFQVLKDGTFAQVEPDFGNDAAMSPCDTTFNDWPNCHIKKPKHSSDRYYYTCKPPYPCIDPGGGPQSGTRMSYMTVDEGPQFSKVVSYDFRGIFNLPQESFAVPGAGPGGASPKVIAGSPAHVRVSCPGGTFTVAGPDPATKPYKPNGQIVWITNLSQLTITDNSNLCTNPGNLAQTGCNITGTTGNYTYTASSTDSTCTSGSPSTQNVTVQP
jgi:hypothetical protein